MGSLWYDSSLLAVVGDGSNPGVSSSRRLRLYNLTQADEPGGGALAELEFLTPIVAIQMNRRRLVVVLEVSVAALLRFAAARARFVERCCCFPGFCCCESAF